MFPGRESRQRKTAQAQPAPIGGLPAHLVRFVEALRDKGLSVGPSETVDAAQVFKVLDILDRDQLREGLACTLLHRQTHRKTFDAMFDLWFPPAIGRRTISGRDEEADGAGVTQHDLPRTDTGELDIFAIRREIIALLTEESERSKRRLDELVSLLVDELGQYRSVNGPSFSAYQALKEIAPDQLIGRLAAGLQGEGGGPGGGPGGGSARGTGLGPTASAKEIATRTARSRLAGFREAVERETRRRAAEGVGRERVAAYSVPSTGSRSDLMRAGNADLAAMRRTVIPLGRLLASRQAARKRRAKNGPIDMRRTMRKSMSTGGVPIDLVRRKPRHSKPELVVLCDMSGSVAAFSGFTLFLVHALRSEFSRVRIFAFIDSTDEVTEMFKVGTDPGVAMGRVDREARLVTGDGHSDYGNALQTFEERYAAAVTNRTALLLIGDARNNYRNPNVQALQRLVAGAKHSHWLNPEPAEQWGTGDSAADVYGKVISMHECRSAEQLSAVVAGLVTS